MRAVTPSQTIGPFWHPLADPALADLTRMLDGPAITLAGIVLDGDGAPVTDACVELWQPGAWGRCATGPRGDYAFTTVMPDPAYAAIAVLARGLVKPLWTRVYFGADPGDAFGDRRHTLVARPGWRWDIRLQGDGETVFFDL